MTNKLGYFLSLASVLISGQAFALGGDSSSGGGAFICKDPSQSEFLDLFEARIPGIVTEAGLTIPFSDAPVKDQVEAAFKRLNPGSSLYLAVHKTYQLVMKARQIPTPKGVNILWPADEKNLLKKEGCVDVGIILFNDNGNSMRIDLEKLSGLPRQQQAAAWVHETIYKFLRETQGDVDSIRARKIVGYLFSNLSDEEIANGVFEIAQWRVKADSLTCKKTSSDRDSFGCNYQKSYPGQSYPFQFDFKLDQNSSDPRCKPMSGLSVYEDGRLSGETVKNVEWSVPFILNKEKGLYYNSSVFLAKGSFHFQFEKSRPFESRKKLVCMGKLTLKDALGNEEEMEVKSLNEGFQLFIHFSELI